ncbi:hypothetical protein SCH01S_15_00320 [Sphingomonas changbaiensis NBRC 104936]|uniref:Uncharacterized protein n=1 Tax=Sphingomonas changbaiensis NBRC 104936 TaxID=1219043 RepID=A0A0E9MKW2_9SPHN|nr:hypothetical protein [Sphingomonas changbaiensis]GAO38407.1 hypothetical protein SCH01S_15_00320 [Sphingomonas changbaiensis NBRC 104936]
MTRSFLLATLALAAIGLGAAASAQSPEPFDPSQVRRLSPEEKEEILANSSERAADAALNSALGGGTSGGIHGEVGAVVGTGGTAGLFGTARIPLGDRGAAIISFEDYRTRTLDPGLLDQFYTRRRIAPR